MCCFSSLLRPGRRASAEADARIRAPLATEALADPGAAEVSETDVRRVARGIREGKSREQVFPKLSGYSTSTSGAGLTVDVRVVKSGGLPVSYTTDPAAEPAAIRTVDLQKKFHMGPLDLASRAGLEQNHALALRRHLGLGANDDIFSHEFVCGRSKRRRYSDNALQAIKDALPSVNLDHVWRAHRTVAFNSPAGPTQACTEPGCVQPA